MMYNRELFTPPASEEEKSIAYPLFDLFHNIHKNITIQQLTAFTKLKFKTIFETVHSKLVVKFRAGKGFGSSNSPTEMQFMLLTNSKSGASWMVCPLQFKACTVSFQRNIIVALETIDALQIQKHIEKYDKDSKTCTVIADGSCFSSFKFVSYVTDTCFSQTNRSTETHDVVRSWYSEKEGLYAFKTEMSLFSTEFFIHFS